MLFPVIVFVDSSYSLLSSFCLKPNIIFYPNTLAPMVRAFVSRLSSTKVTPVNMSSWQFKILVYLFSILPFRSYISACRYRPQSSPFVRYLPDGQLTQILIDKNILPPRRFLSIQTTSDSLDALSFDLHVNDRLNIIIGSNWVEFGSMTLQSYIKYISSLSKLFPGYSYKSHPSEDPSHAANYFPIINTELPLELFILEHGFPCHTVTSGSSATFFLSRLISSYSLNRHTHFFCISNVSDYCDAYKGNITGIYHKNGYQTDITTDCLLASSVSDLQANRVSYSLVAV